MVHLLHRLYGVDAPDDTSQPFAVLTRAAGQHEVGRLPGPGNNYRLRNDLYCVGWGVKLYSNQILVLGTAVVIRAER